MSARSSNARPTAKEIGGALVARSDGIAAAVLILAYNLLLDETAKGEFFAYPSWRVGLR